MARSLLIRNLDETLHARLKTAAVRHRRSLEEEARELLRLGVARQATRPKESLVSLARRLFGPEHGVDLELPRRSSGPERPPPDFGGPEYGDP